MTTQGERRSIFPSAGEDTRTAREAPETPQTRSPAYRLAFHDPEFLCRDELRPVRLQLELLKPQLEMDERGVRSTVVLFGGARIPEPYRKDIAATPRLAELSRYYAEARRFARLCSEACKESGCAHFMVVTGGGPGIMEAGNQGAADAGAPSIGLNIVLPHEQTPNGHITPELCFNFHYFAIRKMHLLMRARAAAFFPGGFGTMDELFETLTLIQTERMNPIPVILFGEAFWREIINWSALRDAGTIAPEDLNLIRFVETADEAWKIVERDSRPPE
jgi:uncharacterized protein (TIGR00730 family)